VRWFWITGLLDYWMAGLVALHAFVLKSFGTSACKASYSVIQCSFS